MKTSFITRAIALCVLLCATAVLANLPGGGNTGTGANVTLTDNGSTVTMANGIMSIVITKSSAQIGTINYTFNNTGSAQTLNLVSGNPNGGKLYWENSNNEGLSFSYAVVANNGDYAEVSLPCTTAGLIGMEVHFAMRRGSTGFYVAVIWSHLSTDAAIGMGECRDNIYAGSIFNWMSVDANRNRLMSVTAGATAAAVQGAPKEVSLWTSGIYAGQYEDKYKYSADFGDERVWGWSSVGTGGKNIGLWNVLASAEYFNGGPMKRELMSHIGTTILNMLNGGHYGGGEDGSWSANEPWTKVSGPYFIYCNNITNALTATNAAAQALYGDAVAQAAAEASAWPYFWFTNAAYAPASGRGVVAGKIVINDSYNPNASASNLWVGVIQQPLTTDAVYDFQEWVKPYQFWSKTDANGNFAISNVIAGANYTLYAYGPGAAGTFQSQAQSGGNTPNTVDIPAAPFSVTVTGGATNTLGTVTWTPTRVGPTVFEIGYPDRTARKFRHGEDWWVGDIGPGPTNPLPVWSKWLEYPFDFPGGPNYLVGQSHWTTDWNFIQPVVTDSAGNYNASTSLITFNLPNGPGTTASLYLALASDYQGPLIVQINGVNIAGANGYGPAYSGSSGGSDASIREGIHGVYSDNRITFAGSLLHSNQNVITLTMRKGGYFANHAMYDYIRLEMTGYIPPPPTNIVAYPGNNANLVCWPVTPGASSYNILRTTTSGSGYVSVTNGVIGPVCGSAWNNATWLDTNTVNGTTYYYVVRSINTVGSSTNSAESPGATPSSALSTTAPAAPTGLTITSAVHHSIALSWSASAGANFYTIYRSTLFNNGGGASNILGTIVLNNTNTTTSFTDTTPTDSSIYSYSVTASSAGGTSGNSTAAVGVALPTPPIGAPATLTATYSLAGTNVLLNWSSVSGAVGYVIRQGTSASGPFTYVDNGTETTYTDTAVPPGTYYYQITPVNAAGAAASAVVRVVAPPLAPASLSAIAGDSQVFLTWTAAANATGYFLYRGTSTGNETTTLIGNYTGTSYTNTGLANGTTYYYVVTATNDGGLSARSPEANATPSSSIVITARNLTWKGDGVANIWDASGTANWLSNTTATTFNNGDAVTFDNTGSNNVAIAITGTLLPAQITFNATKNYTFSGSGSINGSNILNKAGTGTLTIGTTNLYSGGTILSNGILAIAGSGAGGVTANNYTLGSGPLDFRGGTLQTYGYGGADNASSFGSLTNDIIVFGGQTGTILSSPRYTLGSKVTGSGTLTLIVDFVRDDVNGDWSGFTGQLHVRSIVGTGTSSADDDFRIANAAGMPNTHLFLDSTFATNLLMYSRAAANSVIPIGEFAATTNTTVSAGFGTSAGTQNAVTWRVGGLNTDATNAATFVGTVSLIKEGTGTWTLTGTNTHTGATTVSNGLLVVNGGFNGSAVTVAGGALSGTGLIANPVSINNSGGFAPGNPFGTLTISNNLTLTAGSTTTIQIQDSPLTNGAAKISGTLFANGTLNITNVCISLTNGDSFKIFTAGTFSGGFTNILLPPLADGLLWDTNTLKAAGTLSVVTLTPPLIAGIQVVGNNLAIIGNGGAAGWPYQVLTTTNLINSVWTPVATNQFDLGGNFSQTITNAIDPNQPQKFYQLQLQ
ncbi:MAG TPA: polysaccharide lyase family protein [Verrucomicrobiae bacterium]|nr:polysaccharide lyase family protein [Verrucomicrobiae bacterium]